MGGGAIMYTLVSDARRHDRTPHGTIAFPLEIHLDDLEQFEGGCVPSHWHAELEISLLRRGKALYTLGGGCYPLTAGAGMLINANVPHMVTPLEGSHVEMLTLIVHPTLLGGWAGSRVESELLRPFTGARTLAAVPLTAGEIALFEAAGALDAAHPFAYELRMKGLLCEAFYQILARNREAVCAGHPVSREERRRLEQIFAYLHAHADEPLSLARLAETIALSKEGCCRFFKRMTGQTLTQYLEGYRVAQSIPLLTEGDESIAQISAMAGFSSAGRYARAFARRMGCTPGQYRRKSRHQRGAAL